MNHLNGETFMQNICGGVDNVSFDSSFSFLAMIYNLAECFESGRKGERML